MTSRVGFTPENEGDQKTKVQLLQRDETARVFAPMIWIQHYNHPHRKMMSE
jgi:hypothetical protein